MFAVAFSPHTKHSWDFPLISNAARFDSMLQGNTFGTRSVSELSALSTSESFAGSRAPQLEVDVTWPSPYRSTCRRAFDWAGSCSNQPIRR